MTLRPAFLPVCALSCVFLALLASCAELGIAYPPGTGPAAGDPSGGATDQQAAARPAAPTGLSADTSTALSVSLWWGALPSGVDRMLVVLLPAGVDWSPEDGYAYGAGEAVGGQGKVVCSGALAGCSAAGLSVGQACHFLAFAANAALEYSPAASLDAVVPEPPPRFPGFDFSLGEGDFWEYRYYYSIYADWGNTNWSYTRYFTVMLGAPAAVGGKTGYPLSLVSASLPYEPRWRWLALEDSVLYGSQYAGVGAPEEAAWTTIFDGRTGYWRGGGFFVTRAEADYSQAREGFERVGESYRTVVKIGSGSSTQATYTYVPDYGYVASGEDLSYSTAEYFIPGVGPGGYNEAFSLYSSDYQSSETENVTLSASSFEGPVPRDFRAKHWYTQGSIGVARSTELGPGLGGLRQEEDALALPPIDTDTPFLVLPGEREELWRLLESCAAEWQAVDAARSLDLGGLEPGGLVKPGAASEGISFHAEGLDWALRPGASGFLPAKEYILTLAP